MSHEWNESAGEIFVFGSNLLGIHGAGAARFARDRCNAKLGMGEGLTGMAYALPTCSAPGMPLPLETIAAHAQAFVQYAKDYPMLGFFLTRVGCGIAGFTDAEIAPLFAGCPSNVRMPPEWAAYLT
jgi:hypothetical protein